jgi:hypothetical protein
LRWFVRCMRRFLGGLGVKCRFGLANVLGVKGRVIVGWREGFVFGGEKGAIISFGRCEVRVARIARDVVLVVYFVALIVLLLDRGL